MIHHEVTASELDDALRALHTGARVTPVDGSAADDLADAGGIAALLRW